MSYSPAFIVPSQRAGTIVRTSRREGRNGAGRLYTEIRLLAVFFLPINDTEQYDDDRKDDHRSRDRKYHRGGDTPLVLVIIPSARASAYSIYDYDNTYGRSGWGYGTTGYNDYDQDNYGYGGYGGYGYGWY